MKDYKILLISFVLLVFMISAVSAVDGENILTDDDPGAFIPDEQIIIVDDEDSNIKEIYVNDTGDDSNVGSAESPYATIGKAIKDVNTSDIAFIHLSEGTFASDDDSNINLGSFQQKNNGGSLTFIGAGADKTIIDGQDYFKFATLGYNTNITLKDITFTNFKGYSGGVIQSYGGILTIENCVFKDSQATGTQGGAISITNNNGVLTVKDSQFINCAVNGDDPYSWGAKGGGAIFASEIAQLTLENNLFVGTTIVRGTGVAVYSNSKSYIDGNKFINLTGTEDASVFLNDFSGSTIINNEFINCSNPSTSSSILNLAYGNYELKNNTFIKSNNTVGNIYATGTITGLKFVMSTKVINIGNAEINKGVSVLVNATDDMGNIVKTTAFTINFVNDENSYSLNPSNNKGLTYIYFYDMPENGIYNVSITSGKTTTDVLTTADINYSSEPVELYVSPEGNDAANGTHDSPFKTIQHALDAGFDKTFNVVIHLLNGTYIGGGNVELSINNKGTLQLIGEKYGETIIDGNNENWFLSVSTESTFKNLKFVNGYSDGYLIEGDENVYLNDCIIDNSNSEGIAVFNINIDNLTFTNNVGHVELGWGEYEIKNSYFANNTCQDIDGGALCISSSEMTVENCTFINNSANMGGAIYGSSEFKSVNNYFEGNSAENGGAIYIQSQATYEFENNTFINNKATNNGVIGIPIDEVRSTPLLSFDECKFINNSAVKAGVATLKVGKFVGCSFVNNSADYGGVFVLLPYVKMTNDDEDDEDLLGAQIIPIIIPDDGDEAINSLILDNSVFENNIANINGNDIYLGEKNYMYWDDDSAYAYAVPLTITFNDSNVTTLVGNLTATVYGPSNSIIGADYLSFEFDGQKIGSANVVNGVATFNYAGFDDGEYILSGNTYLPSSDNVINPGKISVKLENVLDHVEFWVSPAGDDENGNGSETNPFKSISHAIAESTKNCRNIIIHIGEGIYTGDLNTALDLSSMNNITLMGAGADKTIIDGENTSTFATVSNGNKKVTISDLTIKNMLPDNRESKTIDENVPLVIEEGANLLLNNVEISDNHGGEAIIVNNGNLAIDNSVFKRNGYSRNGIISGGKININNSFFEDTFSSTKFMAADNVIINNSEIKNAYILNTNGPTFDLINAHSNSIGNILIQNTEISNDGSIEALNDFGVITEGYKVNPALNINGNTLMINSSMVHNYNGTLNNNERMVHIIIHAAPFGYTYTVPRNVTVFNSTFINFYALYMATTYDLHNFVFDGCVFKDLEYIAHIRTNNPDSNYNITNSVFLNCSNVINQKHYAQMATPQHVNLNDNYWGTNNQTIVYFLANNGIKEDVVAPDTWIVLTSEDEQTVIKNLTDGENITDYIGNAPIRTDYADNHGALGYAVVFGPVGYLFTTDDDKNVIFNPEDAMYPFVAADPMDYRTPSTIAITGFAGDLGIVCVLVDPVGNPIANATILSIINGENVANVTTDENGAFTVKGIKNGVLTLLFNGTDDYFDTEYNLTFTDAGKTTKSFIYLNIIEADLAVKGTLVDDEGNPIANAVITYTINGENATNVTTDTDGVFQVQGAANSIVDIVFAGSEGADAANTTLVIKDVAPTVVRLGSQFNVTEGVSIKTYAVDSKAGEVGQTTSFKLTDSNGNPIVNATVKFAYKTVILNRTTDENGIVFIGINTQLAQEALCAMSYLGDENYNATFVAFSFDIQKKPITITAPAKTYKASVKTKKYTVTLKTEKCNSLDGKVYLSAGKKVTMKINGKTYTAKTNANGQATFNLKITKKGKLSGTVKFAGDKTYASASKSVKITIK